MRRPPFVFTESRFRWSPGLDCGAVVSLGFTMDKKQSLAESVARYRRITLVCMIPLCLFVACYCIAAGWASGGWRTNRDGEPPYTAPVHHSREFYTGLRW